VDGFSDSVIHWVAGGNDHSDLFLTELIKMRGKLTLQELASSLFAEVIPTMANYSQAITHVVNFYLDDHRRAAREDLICLTGIHSAEAEEKILAYVREALSKRAASSFNLHSFSDFGWFRARSSRVCRFPNRSRQYSSGLYTRGGWRSCTGQCCRC
jgi:hypothetical protein